MSEKSDLPSQTDTGSTSVNIPNQANSNFVKKDKYVKARKKKKHNSIRVRMHHLKAADFDFTLLVKQN